MTGQLADRPRKAREYSVCAIDGCTEIIKPGHKIGRLPGRGWAHAKCINAANKNVGPEQRDGTTKGSTT